ncbi:hypothetical protein WJX81_002426 [Elliptochloris bilobata]|uniref:Uncharacterized protein n=1 Tax=Elliptochloris bilobata TaxID=381761 RepID=A0AAW1RJP1_9CHLO
MTGQLHTATLRLLHFVHHQNRRPADNNYRYWSAFVAEYFAVGAVMRLTVPSTASASARQCTIEARVDVLPQLFHTKFSSGLHEETLFIGNAQEVPSATGPPGTTVVSVGSAVEESAFASVRVRRYGNLCVTFTPELKILAYDFNVVSIDHSLPHAFVRGEMRALEQVVDQQRQVVEAASRGDGGLSAAASAALQRSVEAVQQLSANFASQLQMCTEDGYARQFMRGLKIADLVGCMGDLFDTTAADPALSPLAALQAFAHPPPAAAQLDPSQGLPHLRVRPLVLPARARARTGRSKPTQGAHSRVGPPLQDVEG